MTYNLFVQNKKLPNCLYMSCQEITTDDQTDVKIGWYYC